MSFRAVVLLKKDVSTFEEVCEEIDSILRKYNSNLEVSEYTKKCDCVGKKAREDIEKLTIRKMGSPDIYTIQYWENVNKAEEAAFGGKKKFLGLLEKAKTDSACAGRIMEIRELIYEQNSWESFIQKRINFFNEHLIQHKEYDKPDLECKCCEGKGVYLTKRNPQGYWSKWEIGRNLNGITEDFEELNIPEEFKGSIFHLGKALRITPKAVVTQEKWHTFSEISFYADDCCMQLKWKDIVSDIYDKYKKEYIGVIINYVER